MLLNITSGCKAENEIFRFLKGKNTQVCIFNYIQSDFNAYVVLVVIAHTKDQFSPTNLFFPFLADITKLTTLCRPNTKRKILEYIGCLYFEGIKEVQKRRKELNVTCVQFPQIYNGN